MRRVSLCWPKVTHRNMGGQDVSLSVVGGTCATPFLDRIGLHQRKWRRESWLDAPVHGHVIGRLPHLVVAAKVVWTIFLRTEVLMTQQNADALTKAFAAADQGDPTPLLDLYDDTMTWAGFTFDGTQRVYTKAEFLEGLGVLAKLDASANEVVSCDVIDDELVVAKIRAYRKLGEHELDITMVMGHRFVDGKVVRGNDLVPSSFEAFWSATGLAG